MTLRRRIVAYLNEKFVEIGPYVRSYTDIDGQKGLKIKVFEQRMPDVIDNPDVNAPYLLVNAMEDEENASPSAPFENTVHFSIGVMVPHSKDNKLKFDDDLRVESLATDARRHVKDCEFLKFVDGSKIKIIYGTSIYRTQALAAEIKFSVEIGGTTNKNVSELLRR